MTPACWRTRGVNWFQRSIEEASQFGRSRLSGGVENAGRQRRTRLRRYLSEQTFQYGAIRLHLRQTLGGLDTFLLGALVVGDDGEERFAQTDQRFLEARSKPPAAGQRRQMQLPIGPQTRHQRDQGVARGVVQFRSVPLRPAGGETFEQHVGIGGIGVFQTGKQIAYGAMHVAASVVFGDDADDTTHGGGVLLFGQSCGEEAGIMPSGGASGGQRNPAVFLVLRHHQQRVDGSARVFRGWHLAQSQQRGPAHQRFAVLEDIGREDRLHGFLRAWQNCQRRAADARRGVFQILVKQIRRAGAWLGEGPQPIHRVQSVDGGQILAVDARIRPPIRPAQASHRACRDRRAGTAPVNARTYCHS